MKFLFAIFLSFSVCSCQQINDRQRFTQRSVSSYEDIKESIVKKRKQFSAKYRSSDMLTRNQSGELVDFWVTCIANRLYPKWESTPWDFNGISTQPKHGAIACGYFVTTILKDMDLRINRVKLAICASSVMMRSLTPHQKIKNLSNLNYGVFNDTLTCLGKGVYIVGLDFHTGFIVNDGKENWFIHSNYIESRGVTKETVMSSSALRSSKTRWLTCLTGDKEFMQKWLKG